MTDSPQIVDAYMWSWRVYSIHDDHLSTRPAGEQDRLCIINDRPHDDDILTIRFGGLPPDYYDIKKQVDASMHVALGGSGDPTAPGWLSARDQRIDSTAAGLKTEPIPGKTWLTLEFRRPVSLTDRTGSRYLWNDMSECRPLTQGLKSDAQSAFDTVAASLGAVFPNWLNHIQKEPERVYIGAVGKGPAFVGQFQIGEPTISMRREWADLPIDSLDQAVKVATAMLSPLDEGITAPAQWLTAAGREPDDPFRRFMFAYFGLELLAAKFQKSEGKEAVDKIAAESQLPLHDLVWPLPSDESRTPDRNTMFRFAIMALAVSVTPRQDIEEFRPLMKIRNALAHGSSVNVQTLPAREAEALLKRYLGLVAQKKSNG